MAARPLYRRSSRMGLIDEFHLFVNQAAIGDGLTIFRELSRQQKLTLKKATAFDCGIVALCYETAPR